MATDLFLPDDRPALACSIQGVPLRMMVDTGSTATILRKEVFNSLKHLLPVVRTGYLSGISGARTEAPVVSMDGLRIGNLTVSDLEAYVLDVEIIGSGGEGSVSGVFGMSLLRHMPPLRVDFTAKTVTFG
jgi:predicted aspartyl protease